MTVSITKGNDGTDGADGANGTDGFDARTADGPCFDDINRFVDCGNGLITDQHTGLVWTAKTDCRVPGQGSGMANALRGVEEKLQHGVCGLTDNSQPGDWRLPTEEEALAIMDSSCGNPSLPNQDGTGCVDVDDSIWSFFNNANLRNFLTSTLDSSNFANGRLGNLVDGRIFSFPRESKFGMNIWAVRK